MRRFLLTLLLSLTVLTVGVPVMAQEQMSEGRSEIDIGIEKIASVLKLSDEDPRVIAVRLINVAIGFLAIITVVMILWGGFQFLVSGGQEERTKRAGATIRNAILGLIIILSSWAAVRYVIDQFITATGA